MALTYKVMQQSDKRHHGTIIAALIILVTLLSGIAQGDNYLWPLPASKELTSGFCQWRSGHWHSGIDIRTFGKTGYEVKAIANGYVWRVRTGWRGYGKALYLKLDDGRIAVYAHLERFTHEIDTYVQEQQLAQRRYQVDLYPLEGKYRFKAGETVAISGKSGGTAPHLHFEIRTTNEYPLSPLTFYPKIVDNRPPVIRSIFLRALSPVRGRVNGKIGGMAVALADVAGELVSRDTVTIYGPIGVELECVDRRPNTSRDYAVSRIEMFVDSYEHPIFVTAYDTISFSRWGDVNLDLNYSQSIKGKTFVHNLYQLHGSNVPLVADLAWNRGWIEAGASESPLSLEPGVHRLLFRVYDQSGNYSRASIPIDLKCSPRISFGHSIAAANCAVAPQIERREVREIDALTGSLGPALTGDDADAFRNYLSGDVNLLTQFRDLTERTMLYSAFTADGSRFDWIVRISDNGVPVVAPSGMISSELLGPSPCSSRYDLLELDSPKLIEYWNEESMRARSVCFTLPVVFDPSDSLLLVEPANVTTNGEYDGTYGVPFVAGSPGMSTCNVRVPGTELTIEAGDLSSPSAINIDTTMVRVSGYGAAEVVVISPSDLLLKDQIDIAMPLPNSDDSEKSNIYSVSTDGSASFVPSSLDSNSMLHASISKLAMFAVLCDTIGPRIWDVSPQNGGRVNGSRPKITFKMDDALSGIDNDTSVEITVDGVWAIPEYDVSSKLMVTYSSQNIKIGKHTLKIVVRDQAGNVSEYSSSFRRTK